MTAGQQQKGYDEEENAEEGRMWTKQDLS